MQGFVIFLIVLIIVRIVLDAIVSIQHHIVTEHTMLVEVLMYIIIMCLAH